MFKLKKKKKIFKPYRGSDFHILTMKRKTGLRDRAMLCLTMPEHVNAPLNL